MKTTIIFIHNFLSYKHEMKYERIKRKKKKKKKKNEYKKNCVLLRKSLIYVWETLSILYPCTSFSNGNRKSEIQRLASLLLKYNGVPPAMASW